MGGNEVTSFAWKVLANGGVLKLMLKIVHVKHLFVCDEEIDRCNQNPRLGFIFLKSEINENVIRARLLLHSIFL